MVYRFRCAASNWLLLSLCLPTSFDAQPSFDSCSRFPISDSSTMHARRAVRCSRSGITCQVMKICDYCGRTLVVSVPGTMLPSI
ncbi:hypothetical protein K438DRAFT_1816673 [Mycena galopus ATCC 62051]|nr:hypothetical protein K438DRAFT_1816673 [Mycena galopus ATCC 62051]